MENQEHWNEIDDLMLEGTKKRVFPGAVLLIALHGQIKYLKAYGYSSLSPSMNRLKIETSFDLASLTKPLATTLAIMDLVNQSKLNLESTLESIFCDSSVNIPFDKKHITIRQLLAHTSGYPAYRRYYTTLRYIPRFLRWPLLWKWLLHEPLEASPGERTLYSDLGFMVLQKIVEYSSKKSIDMFISDRFYNPLGLRGFEYSPVQAKKTNFDSRNYVATEVCPWRKRRLIGEVHDENAFVMGGSAGHAGLFGTAQDIYRLLSELYHLYMGQQTSLALKPEVVRTFWMGQKNPEGNCRALGFDMPSETGSSSGQYFSPNSIGHLGFTGTSFWFDLDENLLVVLLTNRVYFGRDGTKIKRFRPMIHDHIREYLGLV